MSSIDDQAVIELVEHLPELQGQWRRLDSGLRSCLHCAHKAIVLYGLDLHPLCGKHFKCVVGQHMRKLYPPVQR